MAVFLVGLLVPTVAAQDDGASPMVYERIVHAVWDRQSGTGTSSYSVDLSPPDGVVVDAANSTTTMIIDGQIDGRGSNLGASSAALNLQVEGNAATPSCRSVTLALPQATDVEYFFHAECALGLFVVPVYDDDTLNFSLARTCAGSPAICEISYAITIRQTELTNIEAQAELMGPVDVSIPLSGDFWALAFILGAFVTFRNRMFFTGSVALIGVIVLMTDVSTVAGIGIEWVLLLGALTLTIEAWNLGKRRGFDPPGTQRPRPGRSSSGSL